MTTMKSKVKKLIVVLLALLGAGIAIPEVREVPVGAFNATRSFTAPQISNTTQVEYQFAMVDMPTDRIGAASSSVDPSGYEFGKALPTSVTAETYATSSFAFTVNESGKVKGCTFDLNAQPTTGTVSVQIQKNGTLQTGKYCKLPRSETFATNGGLEDISVAETITDEITFVAGDRFGLISSSSGLNAATVDGFASIILQLNN